MKVSNKSILVTGGGNGIGRAMVLELLSRGARVVAVDRNPEMLRELEKLVSDASRLKTAELDITQREAVFAFADQLQQEWGPADGLVNNAGIIQPFVRIAQLDFAAIERVMNVNFYGTLYMVKAFLPQLLARPEAHIVNVSSMGGFLPVPGQSVYGASKAAVKLFTEGLYAELLNTAVKVSIVYPGGVGTHIAENSGVNIPGSEKMAAGKQQYSMLTPAAAAQIILNGMETDKTRIYAGKDSVTMQWLYRLSPGFATRLIARKMQDLLPKE
ncbi:MAG: SDR family oxidoreductase [Bacteroidetes bacterium]|nr:SDR family oxidoreductase [Bacteroidota bacterium]